MWAHSPKKMSLPQTVKFGKEELHKFKSEVPDGHTFVLEYWDEFIEDYITVSGRSIHTVGACRDAILMILRKSPLRSIEQFNHPMLLKKTLVQIQLKRKEETGKTFGPVTFNSYIKKMNTFFIWMERYLFIKENRLRNIDKISEGINEQPTLSHEEMLKIVAFNHIRKQTRLESLRNTFFIDMMRMLGARPIEMEKMTISSIKKTANGYKVALNGAKQKARIRRFTLPSQLQTSYENYMEYRIKIGRKETPLFISQSKTTGWTRKGMRRLMKNIREETGVQIRPRSFRRYVATQLNLKGVSIEKIGDHLGHRRTSTTKSYIENSAAVTQETTDIMERLLNS